MVEKIIAVGLGNPMPTAFSYQKIKHLKFNDHDLYKNFRWHELTCLRNHGIIAI